MQTLIPSALQGHLHFPPAAFHLGVLCKELREAPWSSHNLLTCRITLPALRLFPHFRVHIILSRGRKSPGIYLWLLTELQGMAHRCPCDSANRNQGTKSPQELLQLCRVLGTLTPEHFPLQGIKEPPSTSLGLSGEC